MCLLTRIIKDRCPTQKSKKKRRRNKQSLYSRGDINRLVDAAVHPLLKESKIFLVVDELGHMLVERDPRESLLKFTRYQLPQVLKELLDLLFDSDTTKKKQGRE